jgi:ABC-type glycerol-3-phosphate transport system permease component
VAWQGPPLRCNSYGSVAVLCRECAVSVFETIIRVVGGMLAAYELSGEPILLKKYAIILILQHPMGNSDGVLYATGGLAFAGIDSSVEGARLCGH